MHRHRPGFQQFQLPADFGIDFSDSATSGSTITNPASSGLSFEDAFGNQGSQRARRNSRFMESTFRDSTTSQDDMAMPHKKPLKIYVMPPKHDSPFMNDTAVNSNTNDEKNTPSNTPDTSQGQPKALPPRQVFATDDSVVGNFVRPKLRPHPNLSLIHI